MAFNILGPSRPVFLIMALVWGFTWAAVQSVSAQCTEGCKVIHRFEGEAAGDQFGWVANDLGDITGDRVHDLVVTASTNDGNGTNSGRIYVYSGHDGSELFRVTGGPGWALGTDADGIGDIDNDGVRDLAIGAPGGGRAIVVSGVDGSLIATLDGESPSDAFGSIVDDAGDVDGDSRSDIIVTAPFHNPGGVTDAGRAYVYSGTDLSLICAMDGDAQNDGFGASASTAGDLDGDGRAEIVIGANLAGSNGTGRAYIYSYDGESCERVRTFDPTESAAQLGLYFADGGRDVDRDGTPDYYVSDFNANRAYVFSGASGDVIFALTGNNELGGFGIGRIVDDLNADGHADLVLAAWASSRGASKAGKTFVYSGRDGSILETFTHDRAGANFGFDADGMGDVDGDGRTDFLITAASDLNARGVTYVIAGTTEGRPSPRRASGRSLPAGPSPSFETAFEGLAED